MTPAGDEAARRSETFRRLAGGLDKQIAEKSRPAFEGMRMTHRRLRMAASKAADAQALRDLQAVLYALADAWEAGAIPDSLRGLRTKIDVETLLKGYWLTRGANHQRMVKAGITNEADYMAAHDMLKALAAGRRRGRSAQEQAIWLKEREVLLHQIPGFFPSPPPVVERLLDEAALTEGMRVLEPSAGSGSIADAAREAGAEVDCYEVNYTLRELLAMKEHRLVGHDFTEASPNGQRYDRVLMNPPFEQLQDIDHVRHAYEFLAPGGRLVSIMGEGPFFRQDKKAAVFRDWLETQGGWSERLPENSFQVSGTGVNARIVVVERS